MVTPDAARSRAPSVRRGSLLCVRNALYPYGTLTTSPEISSAMSLASCVHRVSFSRGVAHLARSWRGRARESVQWVSGSCAVGRVSSSVVDTSHLRHRFGAHLRDRLEGFREGHGARAFGECRSRARRGETIDGVSPRRIFFFSRRAGGGARSRRDDGDDDDRGRWRSLVRCINNINSLRRGLRGLRGGGGGGFLLGHSLRRLALFALQELLLKLLCGGELGEQSLVHG